MFFFGFLKVIIDQTQLFRLQNVVLYKQFQVQKQKVESKLLGQSVTRMLFHGTKQQSVNNIITNGFDRSHAGNGILFVYVKLIIFIIVQATSFVSV